MKFHEKYFLSTFFMVFVQIILFHSISSYDVIMSHTIYRSIEYFKLLPPHNFFLFQPTRFSRQRNLKFFSFWVINYDSHYQLRRLYHQSQALSQFNIILNGNAYTIIQTYAKFDFSNIRKYSVPRLRFQVLPVVGESHFTYLTIFFVNSFSNSCNSDQFDRIWPP